MSRLMIVVLFCVIIIFFSCRKNTCENPTDYKLESVKYYDSNEVLTPYFKKISYTGGVLTKIETISNNWSVLEYNDTRLYTLKNMLIGVPFPLITLRLNYSVDGKLEQILKTVGGAYQHLFDDTINLTWTGTKLMKANLIAYTKTGDLRAKEEVNYTYSGDNITKCVFEGSYHAYSSGPVFWKDSLEFQYDALPKYFGESSASFFLDEFRLINTLHQTAFRILDPHLDLYNPFDPLFFAVLESRNNIIQIKANGNRTMNYRYITGQGMLQNKVTEMRINEKIVSRYVYKKV